MSEALSSNDLDIELHEAFFELGIPEDQKIAALDLLKPLKEKDSTHRQHFDHSIRVGLLAKRIGSFMNLDQKALFFAGFFHDLGKKETPEELLGKTEPWTQSDFGEIQKHPVDGYEALKGKFDFSAEIIVRHYKFQENGYPENLPPYLHNYSESTKVSIDEYARILSIADVYDALHRENSKFGEKRKLSDSEIEEQMLIHNSDKRDLIENLYRVGIFVNKYREEFEISANL